MKVLHICKSKLIRPYLQMSSSSPSWVQHCSESLPFSRCLSWLQTSGKWAIQFLRSVVTRSFPCAWSSLAPFQCSHVPPSPLWLYHALVLLVILMFLSLLSFPFSWRKVLDGCLLRSRDPSAGLFAILPTLSIANIAHGRGCVRMSRRVDGNNVGTSECEGKKDGEQRKCE